MCRMGTPSLAVSVHGDDLTERGIQQLIDEFVSRGVDESLICAIASDFNLPQEYDVVREILSPLAETALTEEATGFDPSGLGHQSGSDVDIAHQNSHEFNDDASPVGGSHISTTDWTTVSETSEPTCFTSQTDLSEEEKIASLRVIFSNFGDHTLKYMLKDAGGDVEKAFDNLLSRQFLLEEGELAKGIDGFYVGDENVKPGKASRYRDKENKPGRTQLPVNYKLKPVAIEPDDLQEHKASKAWDVPVERYNPVSLSQRPLASSSKPLSNIPTPKPNPTAWQVVSSRKKPATSSIPSGASSAYEPTHLLASSNAKHAASLRRKGPLYQQAAAVYAGRSCARVQPCADEPCCLRFRRPSVGQDGMGVEADWDCRGE